MESTEARAARLAALRQAALQDAVPKSEDDADNEPRSTLVEQQPILKFRNYQPRDEELKTQVMDRAPLPSTEVKPVLETMAMAKPTVGENIADLAPKKANWDLKRVISKKMDALDRATKKALLEIIEEAAAAQESDSDEDDEDESDDEDEEESSEEDGDSSDENNADGDSD